MKNSLWFMGEPGAKLMKIFATRKILQAIQALPLADCKIFFKFSIVTCINCGGKILIWGHFQGIMKLLLKNYLGHILIIEKTAVFLFTESAIKPTPLLHTNVQINWCTECNQLNWWWPECFYKSKSPVTTPMRGQPKLPIRDIHWSYG